MVLELLLLMVAIVAHAAVFVACILPFIADSAQELHKARQARQGQTAQHTSTAAGERRYPCACNAGIVLLSVCAVTMIERPFGSASAGRISASAATAQQQQHASVTAYACTLLHSCVHAMRTFTWSVAAALPLCAARQFEFVRQRQALR